jgi:hypothetical protein
VLRSQWCLQLDAIDANLASLNPGRGKLQVFFIIQELKCFVYAETLETLIILLFKCLSHREISNIFAEAILLIQRYVRVDSKS